MTEMTYQWGAGALEFDSDAFSLRASARHTDTGSVVVFQAGGIINASGVNDPNALATLGAVKAALESGGFTDVAITNVGVAFEPIEEI